MNYDKGIVKLQCDFIYPYIYSQSNCLIINSKKHWCFAVKIARGVGGRVGPNYGCIPNFESVIIVGSTIFSGT